MKHPELRKKNSTILRYTLYGVLFGLCFPVFAWTFDFWFRGYEVSWENFGTLHRYNPMLYMIDTAPFFLGIFAFVAGVHKAATERYSEQLQQMVVNLELMVDARTEELRIANAQLSEAARQAAAFAESKSAFLANMSHEIRTPLNAVIGMATIAQKQLLSFAKPEQIGPSIKQILVSSQHLLRLINNILDLSKIDAGELVLFEDSFSLEDLLYEAAQMLAPKISEKRQELLVKTEGCEGVFVYSDKLRLMQVLINLAGNAIRFTPEGGTVNLIARIENKTEDKATVYFAVQDTGIGISPKNITKLFQRFVQVQDDSAYSTGGTGLGLPISQRIIDLLGGEIKVASTLGQGSTFFFTLSFRLAEAPEADVVTHASSTLDFSGKRILLADDVEVNRLIVEKLLEDTGVKMEMAVDGEEALSLFTNAPAGHFDLIFMDVHMPRMNGYEATRHIRTSDHPDAQAIPIVAMTANAFREDIQKTKDCGMNDFLSKPIDYKAMLGLLRHYLG